MWKLCFIQNECNDYFVNEVYYKAQQTLISFCASYELERYFISYLMSKNDVCEVSENWKYHCKAAFDST